MYIAHYSYQPSFSPSLVHEHHRHYLYPARREHLPLPLPIPPPLLATTDHKLQTDPVGRIVFLRPTQAQDSLFMLLTTIVPTIEIVVGMLLMAYGKKEPLRQIYNDLLPASSSEGVRLGLCVMIYGLMKPQREGSSIGIGTKMVGLRNPSLSLPHNTPVNVYSSAISNNSQITRRRDLAGHRKVWHADSRRCQYNNNQ